MPPTHEAAIGVGTPVKGDSDPRDGLLDYQPNFRGHDEEECDVGEDRNNEDVDVEDTIGRGEAPYEGPRLSNTVKSLR